MSIANIFEGRIRRGHYFGGGIFFSVVYWVISFVLIGVFGADSGIAMALMGLAGIALSLLTLGLTIRRFHDLNKSGFYALLLLIPLVNLFVGLWILFASGDAGANTYGPAPTQKEFLKSILNQA